MQWNYTERQRLYTQWHIDIKTENVNTALKLAAARNLIMTSFM